MYSGEESSRDALNSTAAVGNWQISQSAFNMAKDQVDWAALAQQWIQMKESCANTPCPNNPTASSVTFEEKGEAPMEVVKEDDTINSQENVNSSADVHRYLREWQQPPWYTPKSLWRPGWTPWPANNTAPQPQQDIITTPIPQANMLKGPNAIIPEKNHDTDTSTEPIPTMDAAKRKTLPAWIREGLEKMEKEKQKQLERQKDLQHENDVLPNNNKKLNVSPERLTNDTLKIKNAELFQESDNSDEDDGNHIEPPMDNKIKIKSTVTVTKTREEWMEEWMLIVRRSLTELLLEVTNEEILNVALETLKRNKLKASSAQVFRKSAISSITGKLGLGAYADSASDNSESEDENVEDKYDRDSEDEIKESIKNRQNAFKAIAQEIEQTVNEAEQKEQRKNAEHMAEVKESVKKGFDKDSGETQPDKKMNINGKRNRERTSRFSDVKDSKHKSSTYIFQTAAIPSSSAEFEKRKTNVMPRQYSYSSDSSSESSDSYKNRKRKVSKERKHRSNNKRESSRNSSDSDDYSRRRRYRSSYSRDRTRSRSRSRSHTRKQRY